MKERRETSDILELFHMSAIKDLELLRILLSNRLVTVITLNVL